MKTGVVLECNGSRAVVLDGSGGFRAVSARPEWRPGDVVPLPGQRGKAGALAAAAACLVLALAGGGSWLWLSPAALVSMDVNPSVELTLNRFERVVSARALNAEGAALLEAGTVNGMPAARAVAALLDSGYLEPYLERENYVTLTVQSEDEDLAGRLLALVDETASASVGAQARVSCHGVDGALVEEAHSHGVTAGKYLALLELQAADPGVDITEYTHCGIGEIEEQIERCHRSHGSGAENGGAWTSPGEGCGAGEHHGDRHH